VQEKRGEKRKGLQPTQRKERKREEFHPSATSFLLDTATSAKEGKEKKEGEEATGNTI